MTRFKHWNKQADTRSHVLYKHADAPARGVAFLFEDQWRYGIVIGGYPVEIGSGFGQKQNAKGALSKRLRELSKPRCRCPSCDELIVPSDVTVSPNQWMGVDITAICPDCDTDLPVQPVPRYLDWVSDDTYTGDSCIGTGASLAAHEGDDTT